MTGLSLNDSGAVASTGSSLSSSVVAMSPLEPPTEPLRRMTWSSSRYHDPVPTRHLLILAAVSAIVILVAGAVWLLFLVT